MLEMSRRVVLHWGLSGVLITLIMLLRVLVVHVCSEWAYCAVRIAFFQRRVTDRTSFLASVKGFVLAVRRRPATWVLSTVLSGVHHRFEWFEGFDHCTVSWMAWVRPALRMSAAAKVEAVSVQAVSMIGRLAIMASNLTQSVRPYSLPRWKALGPMCSVVVIVALSEFPSPSSSFPSQGSWTLQGLWSQ